MGNFCRKGRSGLETDVQVVYNELAQNQQTPHVTTENRTCKNCDDLETAAWVGCIKHYLQYAKDHNSYYGNEFHTAAEKGHSNIIRLLSNQRNNIDINFRNVLDQTPLMVSAMHGSIECFIFLLKCGANTEPKDFKGWTAMDYAFEKYHEGE